MDLISEMFKLTFLLMVSLEFGVGSADPPVPDPPVLTDRSPLKNPHRELKDPLGRPGVRVRTVTVSCYPTHMEVRVKADLFGLGMSVDPADLRLGAEGQSGQSCKVTSASDEEYSIQAALTDCGAQHWVTEEALIYTNLLVYSPAPSLDGLVRMEGAVIPVECHYRRKFDVGSDAVLPTWIPHHVTASALENLQFTLRLMTSDWRWERGSGVYFLGDKINTEAVIYTPRMDLRVFIDSCVATATPDTDSAPRYEFIDNGCLLDGQLTGSHSHFLPRESPDRLQLQLDAFMFHQVKTAQIYITCTLKAYPLDYVSESMSKACSFISGSWRSAEGDDWTCKSCQNRFQPAQYDQLRWDQAVPTYRPKAVPTEPTRSQGKRTPLRPVLQADSAKWEPAKPRPGKGGVISPRTLQEPAVAWRSSGGSPRRVGGSVALEQEASVGPLSVFTRRNKLGMMAPPRAREGVPHFSAVRGRRPIPHHSLWRSGELDRADLENEVVADIERAESSEEEPSAAADSEADDGTPESEPTATPTPSTTSSTPSTAGGDSFIVTTASSPEPDTTTVPPQDAGPAADTQQDSKSESPASPSSSTELNSTWREIDAESVTFSADTGGAVGLRKGPV